MREQLKQIKLGYILYFLRTRWRECVCVCVHRAEKLILATGKDKRRGSEVGWAGGAAIRSEVVFSGPVRSAKLALISPVVGDV